MGVGGQHTVLDATPAPANQHLFIRAMLCEGWYLVHRSIFVQCPSHTAKVKIV